MYRNLYNFNRVKRPVMQVRYRWQQHNNPSFLFGIKVAVAGGCCYYLAEEGLWRESAESTKLYGKICTTMSPLVKEVSAQVPIEIPDLPNSERISYVTKQYWNCGVMKTFEFLGELPARAGDWTAKGYEAAKSNPELRKFVDSLTASEQPPPATPTPPPKLEKN